MKNPKKYIQYNEHYLNLDEQGALVEDYPTLQNLKTKLFHFVITGLLVVLFELYIVYLYLTGSDPKYVVFSILPSMIFIPQFFFVFIDFYNTNKSYNSYKNLLINLKKK